MDLHDKFMQYVSKDPSGCWLWNGTIMKNGYGRFHDNYESYLAHRYAFFLFIKTPSKLVCHTCDIRRCVNPAHLFEGDYLANNSDRAKKGRSATGKRNGMHTHPERRSFGLKNGAAKLTPTQVDEIRVLLCKNVPQRQIAKMYEVSQTTVANIAHCRVHRQAAKELK